MNVFYWMLIALLCTASLQGQQVPKPILKGQRTTQALLIDGVLDEAAWESAPIASDFTQNRPQPGGEPSFRTEVRMLYDKQSLYIGAQLLDPAPDSVLQQLGIRDETNVNAANFYVYIDGMLTEQNAFVFGVTAAGVQIDYNLTSDGQDLFWDAVWFSAVQRNEKGWAVEFKIPYSQLRFPKAPQQTWGINFSRLVRRYREESFWSAIDPAIDGTVQQYGLLQLPDALDPPIRLSITPFSAAYLSHLDDGDPQTNDWDGSLTGGMDLKYGINESFTLDVALIPDFGDVQSDNLQFNLSPFEIQYQERRLFFTEGVDLFNRAGLFYSRRIGGLPSGFSAAGGSLEEGEQLLSNPSVVQLLNASKVSGRTSKGTGMGMLNALTGPMQAVVGDSLGEAQREILTEPLANFNIAVIDQQFRNNSYFSLVNTNVSRFGAGFWNANVVGTDWRWAGKKNQYAIRGLTNLSHRWKTDAQQTGYRAFLSYAKVSGRFRFEANSEVLSRDYNPNDFGFLTNANFTRHYGVLRYNWFEPFWWYNNMRVYLSSTTQTLFQPSRFISTRVAGGASGTTRQFLSMGINGNYVPLGTNDFFEPRVEGLFLKRPAELSVDGWFSSDYRKVFALDGSFAYAYFWGAWEQDFLSLRLSPRIRFSDRLLVIPELSVYWRRNAHGFATFLPDAETRIPVIGRRNRQEMLSSLTSNYLFSDLMSVGLRLRHLWAVVRYDAFFQLDDQGGLLASDYEGNEDLTFNAFNIDLIYRWRFRPGSELNIVWKNAILSSRQAATEYNYLRNFEQMFEDNPLNQFSIKLLYFLDYDLTRQWLRKKRIQ